MLQSLIHLIDSAADPRAAACGLVLIVMAGAFVLSTLIACAVAAVCECMPRRRRSRYARRGRSRLRVVNIKMVRRHPSDISGFGL